MNEADFMRFAMKRASDLGARLWRNNVGTGWVGEATRRDDGSILLRNPRPLKAGLAPGSSDLIGFVPVEITEAMVGRTVAVFASVETKSPRGGLSTQQAAWLNMVVDNHGIAGVARRDGDIEKIFSSLLTARS